MDSSSWAAQSLLFPQFCGRGNQTLSGQAGSSRTGIGDSPDRKRVVRCRLVQRSADDFKMWAGIG